MASPTSIAPTKTLTDVANAIRFHNGESRRYTPSEMVSAITALSETKDRPGAQYIEKEPRYGAMDPASYAAIANAIRGQNGETRKYVPSEMAEAVRALEWKKEPQAYALLGSVAGGGKKLLFVRAEEEPQVGSTYKGLTVAQVYGGFEGADYASSGQVPWHGAYNDVLEVEICDPITPKSCAHWFDMFKNCMRFDVAKLDTSGATSFAFMFYYCSAVTELDLSGFSTSNVTNMNYAFYGCSKLEKLTFGAWDMRKLDKFMECFKNMTAVMELDLSGWRMPERTSTMQNAFNNCSKMTRIYAPAGSDMSNTANGSGCFGSCAKLVGGNGTAFTSSNVTAAMARVDGLDGKAGYFTAK